MSQGSVLPPASAPAADVAAAAGRDQSLAADAAGTSFGEVLQAQMEKGLPPADTKAVEMLSAEPTGELDPGVLVAVQPPIDAALMAAAVATPIALPTTQVPAPISNDGPEPVSAPEESPSLPATAALPAHEALAQRVERANADPRIALPAPGAPAAIERRADTPHATAPELEAQAPLPAAEVRPRDAGADVRPMAVVQPVMAETPTAVSSGMEVRRESTATPIKVEVAQPVTAPGWRDAFAERVTWVANARQPIAELQINPPQLGPVEIRVSMNADQANLSFFSPHAAVREAIQASLPRLTDAFAASGLTLGNVLVGAESQSGQQPGEREAASRFAGTSREAFNESETVAAVTWVRPGGGLGRVDLFA